MQNRELYRRILGIEAPWQVGRVELKLETGEVHIYLDHAANVTWSCPECSAPSPLKRRFENIITYLTHPITNAKSESINAKIQLVKYTARGFLNKQNFIDAIYFHCGGLDLAPRTH